MIRTEEGGEAGSAEGVVSVVAWARKRAVPERREGGRKRRAGVGLGVGVKSEPRKRDASDSSTSASYETPAFASVHTVRGER